MNNERPSFNLPWLALLALSVLVPGRAAAQGLDLPAVPAKIDCGVLASVDISPAVGAVTHIKSAQLATDTQHHSYCKIVGGIETASDKSPLFPFQIELPVAAWNQRFLQSSCASFDIGNGEDGSCPYLDKGTFAIIITGDPGQRGFEYRFAHDYKLRISYAYLGPHLEALAGKALITKYYGQAPRYSYLTGCSERGRESVMESQRYPDDFDGIVAGCAPMTPTTQQTFFHAWNLLKNTGPDGQPILTAGKLPILHAAVLAQCDAADGLKDGLISNPYACHPNLSVVQCKPGEDPSTCLTAQQLKVAEAVYRGPRDAAGNKLIVDGVLPGSELSWENTVLNIPSDTHNTEMVFKYLFSDPNPPESFKLSDVKFDRAIWNAVTRRHGIFDANDTDMSPFAKHGGKIIFWNGLADSIVPPSNVLAYFTALRQQMGGAVVDQFARLYQFPGVHHCADGEGPMTQDLLGPLMAWVERDQAPQALVATQFTTPQPAEKAADTVGLTVYRTRLVYPYPYQAQYKGAGDVNDAINFTRGPARPVPADRLKWLGLVFYKSGGEEWCLPTNTAFNCKSTR